MQRLPRETISQCQNAQGICLRGTESRKGTVGAVRIELSARTAMLGLFRCWQRECKIHGLCVPQQSKTRDTCQRTPHHSMIGEASCAKYVFSHFSLSEQATRWGADHFTCRQSKRLFSPNQEQTHTQQHAHARPSSPRNLTVVASTHQTIGPIKVQASDRRVHSQSLPIHERVTLL